MKAQAKRLDNGELVEGYYTQGVCRLDGKVVATNLICLREIDPLTLKYQISNKWFTMSELKALVKPKSCSDCDLIGDNIAVCSIYDDVESSNDDISKDTFYCSKYEPKQDKDTNG